MDVANGDRRAPLKDLQVWPFELVIDDAGVGREFEGRHRRGEGLLLLPGYGGAGSVRAGRRLSCG